ncbi:hypothetical protein Anapl_02778 [Anas platyrhynchos]|uniref:Uncharacterized protein n=1 Tax=Anas platyrhynchos TaxID=8839 RepID=R0K3H7_ANAPL|nr:hypothetical protein Anapl_02778 [Anas platyrhynchos]
MSEDQLKLEMKNTGIAETTLGALGLRDSTESTLLVSLMIQLTDPTGRGTTAKQGVPFQKVTILELARSPFYSTPKSLTAFCCPKLNHVSSAVCSYSMLSSALIMHRKSTPKTVHFLIGVMPLLSEMPEQLHDPVASLGSLAAVLEQIHLTNKEFQLINLENGLPSVLAKHEITPTSTSNASTTAELMWKSGDDRKVLTVNYANTSGDASLRIAWEIRHLATGKQGFSCESKGDVQSRETKRGLGVVRSRSLLPLVFMSFFIDLPSIQMQAEAQGDSRKMFYCENKEAEGVSQELLGMQVGLQGACFNSIANVLVKTESVRNIAIPRRQPADQTKTHPLTLNPFILTLKNVLCKQSCWQILDNDSSDQALLGPAKRGLLLCNPNRPVTTTQCSHRAREKGKEKDWKGLFMKTHILTSPKTSDVTIKAFMRKECI